MVPPFTFVNAFYHHASRRFGFITNASLSLFNIANGLAYEFAFFTCRVVNYFTQITTIRARFTMAIRGGITFAIITAFLFLLVNLQCPLARI